MSLNGRSAAVFGVLGQRSIAWAVASEFHRQGASVVLGIQGPRFRERVEAMVAAEWDGPCAGIVECDVARDDDIDAAGRRIEQVFGEGLDALVHSIAFATAGGMRARFSDVDREDFRVAHDASAYSLVGLTRAVLPSLRRSAEAAAARGDARSGPSVLAMSYLGGARAVPAYGVMGPGKASLEASARALALDLGRDGIRVNCISPGTVNTTAARGIPGFADLHAAASAAVPGPVVPNAQDVARTAAFLASSAAAGIHAQTVYVDGGISAVALPGLVGAGAT